MSSSASFPHTTLWSSSSLPLTGLSMLRGQQVLKNLCESCNNSSQGYAYIIITPTQNYSDRWHFWETEHAPLTVIPTLSPLLLLPFPPPRYLLPSFSFPLCFQFSPPSRLLPSQEETIVMHVLQTLLYFRINWYWFSPEIRHWLNFCSISLAPKLPSHFQAQSTVAPKAHGHTEPTRATQDTEGLAKQCE